ncbi:ubiquinone biosynthesis protein [Chroococcidiopsis sp. FACHB-1243]|uniref:Coq4 family protein n=1 Tax=Chroococcidiopsis sp. [FACHB-1243] TaxID=2692781 RepID=UPI00178224D6|nr:Coq4 family protein [Chroococcidiopsis sp. [FACHB-1243]]MBD2309243.1 ubiquinone biosynthesis protein [Chroococcidiopsis sp. [FACHB-1243]]
MQSLSSQAWKTISHHLRFLKAMKAFFFLLFEPENLDTVDELSHCLIHSRAFELAAEAMKANPEVAAMLKERYIAPAHDLDALLQYPQDSLGYAYASSLKQQGFDRIDPEVQINTDTSYIEYRWQQTHDIWHVITGFGTSEIAEIGLQAFYLAQFRLPLAGMLIANALVSTTLMHPEELPQLLQTIAQGWKMGMYAKPFLAQKWEEAWEKPVSQWRQELNVQAIAFAAPFS